jgi:hypothetical protein
MPKARDPERIRAQAKEALAALRGTTACTQAVLDRARTLLHELGEVRQGRRATAERQAEQQPRPHSVQAPSPTPQASGAPSRSLPSAAPPTKTESA